MYNLKKIVGSNDFSAQFIKMISRYKRLAITLMYCNRLHAWWSTQSRLTTLLSSLNYMPVGRTSDSLTFPTLSRGLMFCLCVRPTRVYLLDFFCSDFRFYLLLSPYLGFISFLYLDLYVLGDDALICWGSFMQNKDLCVFIHI